MASTFYRYYLWFYSEGVSVVDLKHMRSVIIKFNSSICIKKESLLLYYSVKLSELRAVIVIFECGVFIVNFDFGF
jgi:hypothetical protein